MNSVTGIPLLKNYFNSLNINPFFFLIILIVIIFYIIFFSSLGNETNLDVANNDSSTEVTIFGIIMIALFIVLVVINGFNHFLNIDIITSIRNIFTATPEIDIRVNNNNGDGDGDGEGDGDGDGEGGLLGNLVDDNEVFNVQGNHYTYNDARAICKAYGGRLATYREIEDAYNEGGEWCNYGWSENQLALFPTQYKTWNRLQKIKGHENDCGRPGINGGFINNPSVKFGVNCFGQRPKITPLENNLMKLNREVPITRGQQELQERIDYWRSRIPELLLSPFNRKNWSRF